MKMNQKLVFIGGRRSHGHHLGLRPWALNHREKQVAKDSVHAEYISWSKSG